MELNSSLEAYNTLCYSINFPAFYATRMFLTVYTGARHWPLYWARWIQSTSSKHVSLNYSFYLCLGLPSNIFSLEFPAKRLYMFIISSVRAKCSAHLILVDLVTLIISGNQHNLRIVPLRSFLRRPVLSTTWSSNILLNSIFSRTLNLYTSLDERNQVSRLYSTSGDIFQCIVIFSLFYSRREDVLWTYASKYSAADTSNKQSRTADKVWSFSLMSEQEVNKSLS